MNVSLVYTVNATGACTPTQMAAELLAAWDGFDLSVLTTVYLGCTIASVTTAETSTQASITIVVTLSAAFLAAFPNVADGEDPSPFLELFTAQFRAAVTQPVMAATPVYQIAASEVLTLSGMDGTATTNATATVTGSGPTPTGTIQFLVNGVASGPVETLAGGVFNNPALDSMTPGANNVQFSYSGDSHYAAGLSNILVHHWNP